MIGFFAAWAAWLAHQTGDEAKAKWPKGPKAAYREIHGVPVSRYAGWLLKIEASPALSGSSATQVAQRVRRLYFSSFTEAQKPGVGNRSDEIINDKTTYAEPPLTTDHVDQATLDGLYSTSTIVTARGIHVDIGHLWLAIDLAMANADIEADVGEAIYLDSELEALFTWAGDLGAVANDWASAIVGMPQASRTEAVKKAKMLELVNGRAARDDLLGDMDAVILARYWDRVIGAPDPLVISAEFLKYYRDDAMPQAQAKQLSYPNSARRFHHFMKVADPSLPGSGKGSSPLEVSVVRADLTAAIKPIVSDAADDFVGRDFSFPRRMEAAGSAHFDKLCDKFAGFLEAGLASGMAEWPPNSW
jgi:hypothetical protein